MDTRTYEFSPVAKMLFGYTDPCPYETAQSYGHALICIAGADEEVSQEEMDWLTKFYAYTMGVPKDLVAAWESFDFRKGNLEEILKSLGGVPVNFKKSLIYDAIRMSSADGYVHREKLSVYKAAELLGIDKKTVAMLECLVEVELSLRKQVALMLEVPSAHV